jgi:hypothetical protein
MGKVTWCAIVTHSEGMGSSIVGGPGMAAALTAGTEYAHSHATGRPSARVFVELKCWCSACGGEGRVRARKRNAWVTCPECKGKPPVETMLGCKFEYLPHESRQWCGWKDPAPAAPAPPIPGQPVGPVWCEALGAFVTPGEGRRPPDPNTLRAFEALDGKGRA